MKINCVSCGHSLDLDEVYANDYDGEVKCWVCGGRLALRTERGRVRNVRLIETNANHAGSRSESKAGNQAPDAGVPAQERK